MFIKFLEIWFCIINNSPNPLNNTPLSLSTPLPGKKRAWIPDEKEAYIEIEIKDVSGDKVIVETKDGRVNVHPSVVPTDTSSHDFNCICMISFSCLCVSIASDPDSEGM